VCFMYGISVVQASLFLIKRSPLFGWANKQKAFFFEHQEVLITKRWGKEEKGGGRGQSGVCLHSNPTECESMHHLS